MDEKPRRHWFRFSLRTLLLAVAILAAMMAAYRHLPNPITGREILRLKAGMKPAEVEAILGKPERVVRHDDYELWWYESRWRGGYVRFRSGLCIPP